MKVRLKELGTISTGNTPSKKVDEYWSNKDIKFIKPDVIKDELCVISSANEYISASAKNVSRIVPANSILVTCIGEIGRVGITEEEVSFNQQINAIVPNEAIIPKYLAYAIYANRKQLKAIANAPVVPIINKTQFSDFEISIFESVEKQNKIVRTLDVISDIITNDKKKIEALDNLIKARFVEMFGNVVVNDKSWPTKPISNVVPASSPKITVSENIWLLNLDMIESQSGKVLDRLIVSKNKINASTCAFDDKNVLYSKLRPYLNKVVLPDQEGYCTTELVPLRPSNELNREFLATLLRSDAFVGYINEKTAGAKMPRVSMNIFRQFECILPPITLQEQFSAFYKQVDKSKFALSNELAMCNFYVRLINDSITHSRIDLRMSE